MLFEKNNLTLSKIIGQGKQYHSSVINLNYSGSIIAGESGLVYRGYIDRGAGRELVAVKTGKGILLYVL